MIRRRSLPYTTITGAQVFCADLPVLSINHLGELRYEKLNGKTSDEYTIIKDFGVVEKHGFYVLFEEAGSESEWLKLIKRDPMFLYLIDEYSIPNYLILYAPHETLNMDVVRKMVNSFWMYENTIREVRDNRLFYQADYITSYAARVNFVMFSRNFDTDKLLEWFIEYKDDCFCVDELVCAFGRYEHVIVHEKSTREILLLLGKNYHTHYYPFLKLYCKAFGFKGISEALKAAGELEAVTNMLISDGIKPVEGTVIVIPENMDEAQFREITDLLAKHYHPAQ